MKRNDPIHKFGAKITKEEGKQLKVSFANIKEIMKLINIELSGVLYKAIHLRDAGENLSEYFLTPLSRKETEILLGAARRTNAIRAVFYAWVILVVSILSTALFLDKAKDAITQANQSGYQRGYHEASENTDLKEDYQKSMSYQEGLKTGKKIEHSRANYYAMVKGIKVGKYLGSQNCWVRKDVE